eukprot:403347984
MNVEFQRSFESVKPGETPPFILIDVREQSERDYCDLPEKNLLGVKVPRMNIPLNDLLQGFYPEQIPKDKHIICFCAAGLRSGRASHFLKRNGFHAKSLVGGIEGLEDLINMKIGF